MGLRSASSSKPYSSSDEPEPGDSSLVANAISRGRGPSAWLVSGSSATQTLTPGLCQETVRIQSPEPCIIGLGLRPFGAPHNNVSCRISSSSEEYVRV